MYNTSVQDNIIPITASASEAFFALFDNLIPLQYRAEYMQKEHKGKILRGMSEQSTIRGRNKAERHCGGVGGHKSPGSHKRCADNGAAKQ